MIAWCRHLIVSLSRYFRWLLWGATSVFAFWIANDFEAALRSAENAPQQCVAAGTALVYLMALYVVARAWDRMAAIVADSLAQK